MATQAGAEVSLEAVETVGVRDRRSTYVSVACVQEDATGTASRRNCQSKFKRNAGCGRFHIHTEEREPSNGRNHCIDGLNLGDLIRTLGMRNDKGHG